MTDLSDRRKEKRKVVMAFTPVFEKGKLLGYLRDLTLQGAQVNGEKTLEVNTQTILSIELPVDLPEITAKQLNIPARVARCLKDEKATNSYELGFEFSNLQPEHIQIVEKLLDRYHFRHKLD